MVRLDVVSDPHIRWADHTGRWVAVICAALSQSRRGLTVTGIGHWTETTLR